MSKTPPWTVDSDAYLADTHHLSGAAQHGAYLLIMLAMWRSAEGVLADDDQTLARAAHLTLDKWRRMAPVIRPLLQPITSGITQKRLRRDKLAANRTAVESERPSQNPSQNPGMAANPLEYKAPDSGGGYGHQTDLSLSLPTEAETLRKVSKREVGIPLPDDWEPNDKSRLRAKTKLGLDVAAQDRIADRMRRWAGANRHRKEARKAGRHGWDLTYDNWCERDAHRELHYNGGNNAANQQRPAGGSTGQTFATRALARARPVGDEGS